MGTAPTGSKDILKGAPHEGRVRPAQSQTGSTELSSSENSKSPSVTEDERGRRFVPRLMNEVATFWVQAFYRTSRNGVGAGRRESHVPVRPSGCAEQEGSMVDWTQSAPVRTPRGVKRKKKEKKMVVGNSWRRWG